MILLIVFLPLFGFLYCAFLSVYFNVKYSQIITSFFLIITAVLSWIILFKFLGTTETYKIHLFNWITSGDFIADLEY